MRAARVSLRDFRNYERADVELGDGLTVVAGPNGAGKTNLLEAICFACTARSPRTSNEREVVRRGEEGAHVALEVAAEGVSHLLEVGLAPGEGKRIRVDGAASERPATEERPLVSVFLPERLELVKGPPAGRRAHLDRLVSALWPARAETRASYSKALAQRNALLARVRAGASGPDALSAWETELAQYGAVLMADRREAAEQLRKPFAELASRLGLPGRAELRYRPRSAAADADELAAELLERRGADLERGFTAHGPHRDEVVLSLDGMALRSYGSQGQQRTALLALLFAEREILAARGRPPLMLLDDVMSELDGARRELLAELLREGGQAVLTTTDTEYVPALEEADAAVLRVIDGRVLSEVAA